MIYFVIYILTYLVGVPWKTLRFPGKNVEDFTVVYPVFHSGRETTKEKDFRGEVPKYFTFYFQY